MKMALAATATIVATLWAASTLAQQRVSPSVASARANEQLFQAKCGMCHAKGGTGTLMLEKRLGAGHGVLAERKDLNGDYIGVVVRNGLMSMPAITRVEVTDAQLAQIERHLLRNNADQAK